MNVILLTLDAVTQRRLSCYGYDKIKTKAIDSLAEEGVLFENVIAQSCLTPIAHACILSGKYPNKTKVRDPFCKVRTTLISTMLKEKNYHTAGFVGINFLSAKHEFNQGFDIYDEPTEETAWNRKKYKKGEQEKDSIWGNWWIPRMLNWIEEHQQNNFFIWGHYFNVHYHAEKQMLKDGKLKEGHLSDDGYYDAKIEYMDKELIQPMIDTLKKCNIYDDTIIIITADHGESFLWEYPQHRRLYEDDLRIPLIIKNKHLKPQRISHTVRSIDIVPTILEMLEYSSQDDFDGLSLLPLINGKEFPELVSYSEELYENRGPGVIQSLRNDYGKIIVNRTTGKIEMYDLQNDPDEKENLVEILDYMYDDYKMQQEISKVKSITKNLKV